MISINEIKDKALHSIYPNLYGKNIDLDYYDNRFISLLENHFELFKNEKASIFSTAGRTELGGNHTDHNLGKVLAASINLDTIAAVNKTDDNIATIISEGFDPVSINLNNLDYSKNEENTTQALVRGIAYSFSKRNLKVGGFVANTTTNVLKGSGLSSSAAIEVLCATIFNHLYNNDILTPLELAQIGQFAENNYYGKPSGLMDQLACASGGIISIDFKEKETPKLINIPFNFNEMGYDLIIIDTKGSHDDLTHCYSSIPFEMKEIAQFFNKEVLREVSFSDFLNNLPLLKATIKNDRAILRAFHYFNENLRVEQMCKSLEQKDVNTYFKLVKESGKSSYEYLQNLYDNTNPKEQSLGVGLALLDTLLGDKGAYRVHGGGFAGTIQAYIPLSESELIISKIKCLFGKDSVTKLHIRKKETICFA
ncbi:MAG: galactokinase [Pleomorphochaeta sp.]